MKSRRMLRLAGPAFMKSTIVVENDSTYTLSVEGTAGGEPVREVMKARRVGDCSR
jgi:hypothetical protein